MSKAEKDPPSRTLYSRMIQEIRGRILSGDLAEGMRLPTELELARRYQVSRGTVRQALGVLVNEGLLERIQGSGTFVRRLPGPASQDHRQSPGTQQSIGLILSQAGDELNLDILLGVEQAVKPRGYHLSFAYVEENARQMALDIARLRHSTAGLIIFPLSDTPHDPSLAQLQQEHIPFVLVDRYLPTLDCDYVVSDNVGGGYRATEHLLILGHRRIGFVSSSRGGLLTTSVRDRWEGYRKALREYRQPYEESLVYQHVPTPAPEPPNVYDEIITAPDRPTAFFAVNDAVALALLQAAQRHGLRVPEDVALVGFDDISYAAHLSVPLTTVAQQRAELGVRAGTLLINRIEGQIVGGPKHIELPTNLVIRQSCGARVRFSGTTLPGSE